MPILSNRKIAAIFKPQKKINSTHKCVYSLGPIQTDEISLLTIGKINMMDSIALLFLVEILIEYKNLYFNRNFMFS